MKTRKNQQKRMEHNYDGPEYTKGSSTLDQQALREAQEEIARLKAKGEKS